MKRLIFLPFLLLVVLSTIQAQKAIPYSIGLDAVASGFSSPVDIANAGDTRLFVVERSGRIRILNTDGSINPTPFLDINDRVVNTGGQSERGLLALEFHHDYATTGWFFVHYNDNSGNTVIARFSVDPNDENIALPDSEKIIFTLDQPFTNHNGGSIKFGPDNMLYIGMGDGGSANDPLNASQNTGSLLGKMLRIDVDNGDPYAIPTDNPFVNDPNVLDEIWATGIRNPWKFSFDRVLGDLWIADVGQGQWEEINFQKAGDPGGQNYGWRCREGNHDAVTSGCNGPFEPAAAEYNHEGFTHCSVTGGYAFLGGDGIFEGAPPIYFYADYCSGTFWGAMNTDADGVLSSQLNRIGGNAISTFGEDSNGELYVAALNNGTVFKLNYECDLSFTLETQDASCLESVDGRIVVPNQSQGDDMDSLYALEIVNTVSGEVIEDSNAVPAGSYDVTISRFGCSREVNNVVIAAEIESIAITFDSNTNVLSTTAADATYQWFLNGEILANATTQDITLTEPGNYMVEVTFANGCVSSSPSIAIDNVLLSANTIEQLTSMKVQPNPAEDFLTLSLVTESFEQFDLKISDIQGKVHHTQAVEVQGQTEIKIDLRDFPSGVYLLMLSDGQATQTEQIVKQ